MLGEWAFAGTARLRANVQRVAQRHLREVERLARKAAEARAAFVAAILAAHNSGETYSDIARAAGVTRQRIAQIVAEARRRDR